MARRTLAEAAAAMRGTIVAADPVAAAARAFAGVALDSRQVRGGELFFALAGETTDGHRFAAAALAAGAAAAVTQRDPDPAPAGDRALIRVTDTFAALHDLTRALRRGLPGRLIGITGSAGKTTTKDLLAAMLARRHRVAASPGNLNNLYGFPQALAGVPEDTEWMVAEMGMSMPGELGRLSRLARPNVVVLTNVRPVHLEHFADVDAIAEAKAEILEGLAPGGTLVANADDPRVARIARHHATRDPTARVVWFGRAGGPGAAAVAPDVTADEAAPDGEGARFVLAAGGRRQPVALALAGAHNVDNALAAAATAWVLGVPLEEIAAAAATVAPAAHRGEVHPLPGGGRLVDDCYNSNPEAVALALAGAAALPVGAGGRRWAVLGDMLELGPQAPRFHREAGETAARAGFSPVAAVGELARELAAGAARVGAEAPWFADAAAAADWAPATLAGGDVVLVKGSRGVKLEAVVDRLLAAAREVAS